MDDCKGAFEEIKKCVVAIENYESAELEYGTIVTLGKIKRICSEGITNHQAALSQPDPVREQLVEALRKRIEERDKYDLWNTGLQIAMHETLERFAVAAGIDIKKERWWDTSQEKRIEIIEQALTSYGSSKTDGPKVWVEEDCDAPGCCHGNICVDPGKNEMDATWMPCWRCQGTGKIGRWEEKNG